MALVDNTFQIPQFLVIDPSVSKDDIFTSSGSGEYSMSGLFVFIPAQKYPVIYKNKCIAMVVVEDCQMSAHGSKIFTSVFYRYVEISQEDANAFTHLWMMNAPAEEKKGFATPGSMGFGKNDNQTSPNKYTKKYNDDRPNPWDRNNHSKGSKRSTYRHVEDTGRFKDL